MHGGLSLTGVTCHIGCQIHAAISPQAFNNDVVAPRAPAIHATSDLFAQQHTGEGLGSEAQATAMPGA